jgi:uncharacterized membrane protein YhaH (DUF805 family)
MKWTYYGRSPKQRHNSLVVFIPNIAVAVGKLQAIGKSWVYLQIGFMLLLGVLILIYFFVKEGNHGPNEYGPDPKGEIAY